MSERLSHPNEERTGIGTLNENSLHAEIIKSIAQNDDLLEAKVEGYVVDILTKDKAIEVQTRNLGKIAKKVKNLSEIIPVEIIFPIQKTKIITKIGNNENILTQRKSPKQGRITDVFDELVRATDIFSNPGISLTILMIEAEEIWKNDGQGSWRRKGWSIQERKLIKIISSHTFISPESLLGILPRSLPIPFSNQQLATTMQIRPRSAGKITYTLRMMGLVNIIGKNGNANLFEIL